MMDKEQYLNLENRINALSREEYSKRLDYLKKLSNGTIQGPQVGYPSIDQPWLRYIDLIKMNRKKEKKTIYQEIRDNNKYNLKNIAIEFFGTKIKYKKLLKKIDKFARAFVANGIGPGKTVTISCAGIPEVVYAFYALAKIGAKANFMSPFFDKEQMIERIKDCDSELLLVMDDFYDEIKPVIEKSIIKKTVILPTLNSSVIKFLRPIKKVLDKNVVMVNDFVEEGKSIPEAKEAPYVENNPLAIVYSSGTTGASKGIDLSNDSYQNSVHSYEACGIDLSGKQKFYQIIPPWFSTGSSTSIHLPLVNGATVFMDPRFERDIFIKNIVKHKINATVAPSSMYEGFLDKDLVKNADLSNFTNPFEGGEPLKKETKENIEKVFHEHGSTSNLKIGFGQCECGAGITTQTDDFYRSDGSVGIPIPGVIVTIMDEERNELTYNHRGEILVSTSSGMLGYYKNEEATNEYFYTDEAGTKWSCTGDIGYMDNEGQLFVQGRKSDYTIVNNKQIYNFDIENIILSDEDVKNVDVLPYNGIGDTFVVHLILNDEIQENLTGTKIQQKIYEIQQKILLVFNDKDYVPKVFKIRKDFPYAKSGKRDTESMKNEMDGFILSVNPLVNENQEQTPSR